MTPTAAALLLETRLADLPTLPPLAWQALLRRVVPAAAAALRRQQPFNARDQALLGLTHRLTRAGAHASWRLAQDATLLTIQVAWQVSGRWHHDLHVAVHAGWERRLAPGSNRALPLEANQIVAPLPVQTTALAQTWLDTLTGDYQRLSAANAALGLTAIPGGVWITPPS